MFVLENRHSKDKVHFKLQFVLKIDLFKDKVHFQPQFVLKIDVFKDKLISKIPSAECIELSILSTSDGLQRKFFVEEVEAVWAAVVDFFVVEGDVAATEADHCGVS